MCVDPEEITTRFFKPLEQDTFFRLEYVPYLKGLFKGKRTWDECVKHCEKLRDELITLGKEAVLTQVKAYPFALLPIELALQTTGAGTAFLRWRKKDRSAMGVGLWDELLKSPSVSDTLISDLYAIEVQRIELNMQISLVHSIARRVKESAEKAAHARNLYHKRMVK